jgi:predicted 3-demethylubiquinone-9 3-methyltransferase (glyoxalase superfamily)
MLAKQRIAHACAAIRSRSSAAGLKDKYGLSWQIVPSVLSELLLDHESENGQRAMEAMLHMKKIDINDLERAVGTRIGS